VGFAGRSHDGLTRRRPLAETAPFSQQCSVAKQGWLNREHIEAGHVPGRIATFEHEVLHREIGHASESQLPKGPSN
jgi:hypothetical protein